ncbi:Heavy metal-associated isoprenylated plant protein 20 [Glycine soja]
MGALDYLSNFCTVTSTRTKQKAMQTTEIKVRMDCDGCERRVRNAVSSIKGVKSVEVNRKESRVVVRGYVDPKKVLKRTDSENRTCNYKCGVYAIQKMDPFQNTSGYNNVIDYR